MAFKKKTNVNADVDLSKVGFADLEKGTTAELQKEQVNNANKLVHCIVTCLDPSKSKLQGEIFSARNAQCPEIKKMVVYGVPTHVPQIILNVLKEKKYQQFTRDTQAGMKDVSNKTKLIPAYQITILPPLTGEELDAIKQRQLAEGYGEGEDE